MPVWLPLIAKPIRVKVELYTYIKSYIASENQFDIFQRSIINKSPLCAGLNSRIKKKKLLSTYIVLYCDLSYKITKNSYTITYRSMSTQTLIKGHLWSNTHFLPAAFDPLLPKLAGGPRSRFNISCPFKLI